MFVLPEDNENFVIVSNVLDITRNAQKNNDLIHIITSNEKVAVIVV